MSEITEKRAAKLNASLGILSDSIKSIKEQDELIDKILKKSSVESVNNFIDSLSDSYADLLIASNKRTKTEAENVKTTQKKKRKFPSYPPPSLPKHAIYDRAYEKLEKESKIYHKMSPTKLKSVLKKDGTLKDIKVGKTYNEYDVKFIQALRRGDEPSVTQEPLKQRDIYSFDQPKKVDNLAALLYAEIQKSDLGENFKNKMDFKMCRSLVDIAKKQYKNITNMRKFDKDEKSVINAAIKRVERDNKMDNSATSLIKGKGLFSGGYYGGDHCFY